MTLEEILKQLKGASFPLSHVGGGPVVDLDRAETAAEEAYEAGKRDGIKYGEYKPTGCRLCAEGRPHTCDWGKP